MSGEAIRYSGGCLCGALRYVAEGEPLYAGLCYCSDCQKSSGSSCIPFLGFGAATLRFSGQTRQSVVPAARGGDAVRNFCARCNSLVFGGVVGESDSHTIYAGSLDDPSRFHPTFAIFARSCPAWAVIPPHLTIFQELPPHG